MDVSGQVLAYGRVSTEEQSDDEGALVKQLRRLREAGATKIFYDIDRRTNDKRVGINQALEYIQEKPVGAIAKLIFTRLDRITASPMLFYRLVEVCRRRKVKLVALDDAFDIDTVGGEFSADVRVAVARHEVKMLSLRVRKDLETRAKANKPHYFAPFGYRVVGENYDRYEKDNTPLVCLIEGKRELTVADVARLRIDVYFAEGSARSAARRLNNIFGITRNSPVKGDKQGKNNYITNEEITDELWTKSKQSAMIFSNRLSITATGLQNWITNPILAGGVPRGVTHSENGKKYPKPRSQWNIAWNIHLEEAIITMAERERILEITAKNAQSRWLADTPKTSNIFSGLVRCGQCGSACSIQGTRFRKRINRTISHFQCNYYRNERLCSNKTMVTDIEIEKQLIPLIVQEAERLSALGAETQPSLDSQEITELRRQLAQLEAISGNNPAILKAIEEIHEQMQNAVAKKVNEHQQSIISRERIIAAFANPIFWESIDNPADKKRLISEVVAEIKVNAKKIISIRYINCT